MTEGLSDRSMSAGLVVSMVAVLSTEVGVGVVRVVGVGRRLEGQEVVNRFQYLEEKRK